MKNERILESSIANFGAISSLIVGWIYLLIILFNEIIEKSNWIELIRCGVIFCLTLLVYSIFKVIAKISDYLQDK
jgi:hypothetical protein